MNHNIEETENILIYCCLISDPTPAILQGVDVKWFRNPYNMEIWRKIVEFHKLGQTFDLVNLREVCKSYTHATNITKCIEYILTPKNDMLSAVEVLRRNYLRRQISDYLHTIQRRIYNDYPDILIDEMMSELPRFQQTSKNNNQSVYEKIKTRLESGIIKKTGYPQLDYKTKGIDEGALWIIGGATSSCKTMLLVNIIYNLIQQGKSCCLFSAEMSQEQILMRIGTIATGINPTFQPTISEEEKMVFLSEIIEIEKLPISVIQTNSLSQIRLTIQQKQYDVYFVDYLQLIYSDFTEQNENEVKRLGYICRELATVSREYSRPVVATSQFHRERQNPTISSYRGSGEIEEATDIGILLWIPYRYADEETKKEMREKGTDKILKLEVCKNRLYGLTGVINYIFDPYTLRIRELEKGD